MSESVCDIANNVSFKKPSSGSCLHQLWAGSYQQQTPDHQSLLYILIKVLSSLLCCGWAPFFIWTLFDFHSVWTEQILEWERMWNIAKWAQMLQIYFTFPRQVLHENSRREVFVCKVAKFHWIKCAIKECIWKRSNVWWQKKTRTRCGFSQI